MQMGISELTNINALCVRICKRTSSVVIILLSRKRYASNS